jgi:hypothetical protein
MLGWECSWGRRTRTAGCWGGNLFGNGHFEDRKAEMMITFVWIWRSKVAGMGTAWRDPGSCCPMAGFIISGVEASGSAFRAIVHLWQIWTIVMRIPWVVTLDRWSQWSLILGQWNESKRSTTGRSHRINKLPRCCCFRVSFCINFFASFIS